MMEFESAEFIENEIKTLWPEWVVSEAELAIWAGQIRPFSKASMLAAVKEFYLSKEGQFRKRPNLHAILFNAKKYQPAETKQETQRDLNADLVYACKCIENEMVSRVGWIMNFFKAANKPMPPDQCREAMVRNKCEQLGNAYGGRWCAIRIWETAEAPF